MKRYFALLAAVLLIFAPGCAKRSPVLSLSSAAAADQVISSVKFKDQMSPVDQAMALQLYGLDCSIVTAGKVYESTGATAEEVAVFETKDAAAMDKVKQAVQKRIEVQREGFQDYQPREMEKLKNPLVVTAGNCVILCVSDDNAAARKAIDGMMK